VKPDLPSSCLRSLVTLPLVRSHSGREGQRDKLDAIVHQFLDFPSTRLESCPGWSQNPPVEYPGAKPRRGLGQASAPYECDGDRWTVPGDGAHHHIGKHGSPGPSMEWCLLDEGGRGAKGSRTTHGQGEQTRFLDRTSFQVHDG
jgi:hypothetical protein